MEHNNESPSDKKMVSKAKSKDLPLKLRGEKRPITVDEAVKSLDLAMGRLKRGRIISNVGLNNSHSGPLRRGVPKPDVIMDTTDVPPCTPGIETGSLMSLNFSHYELLRNLSCTNNSEGAFSDTTSMSESPTDMSLKREHLERYFQSVETWNREQDRADSEIVLLKSGHSEK